MESHPSLIAGSETLEFAPVMMFTADCKSSLMYVLQTNIVLKKSLMTLGIFIID